jgi:multiple sugar transport system substrate-binding protein
MRKKPFELGLLTAVGAMLAACSPTVTATVTPTTQPVATATEAVEIHWFTGLGTGADPAQYKAEQAAVEAFNQTVGREKNIKLTLEAVSSGLAEQTLAARIADGNTPDIVGPVGMAESNAFHDQWMDLNPYLMETGFDTSVFPDKVNQLYSESDSVYALPFAVTPSVILYNTKIFNQAGLAYPPSRYGAKYVMPDGSEVDWTWDNVAALARRLTIDGSSLNATDPGFQSDDIRQYGFTWQNAKHPNEWGAYWAGGTMLASDKKSAKVPDGWKAAWRWTYDAIWSDQPFLSKDPAVSFFGDTVAMTALPFGYSCCLEGSKNWDVAVLPSNNGSVSGRMEEATFRILKGTQHPQEAFTVLTYLVTAAVDILIIGDDKIPAAFPAVPALLSAQDSWRTTAAEKFTWAYNLQAVLDGVYNPDLPSVEGYTPHFDEAWSRGEVFADLLRNRDSLDLEIEITIYVNDLTVIFSRTETL